MVHEHKFKDLLSSTCQVNVERRVLDLELEAMRSLVSIPTGGNILSLDFISHSKASDANIAIIANFVQFVKNPNDCTQKPQVEYVVRATKCIR